MICAIYAITDTPASQRLSFNFWKILGTALSSGGFGSWLLRVDQAERARIQYQQLLDIVRGKPDSKAKEKAVYDLVQKLGTSTK